MRLGLAGVLAIVLSGATAAQNVYPSGAVSADHVLASRAGALMLREGGNAVDAAVAASFTLSVVRPYSCGIGGGGFMVVHMTDDPRRPGTGPVRVAFNYRETAPAWAGPETFVSDADPLAPARGGRSVCVPGTVAGLLAAHERFGRLSRARVLAPAIEAAEAGFDADEHYVTSVHEDVLPIFERHAEARRRFAFVWERYLLQGRVRAGDRIHVPEQAEALRLIARDGASAFYDGPIGEAIVRAANADGARLTRDDLRRYGVVEFPPIESHYRGLTVLGMPPPSSGGVAVAQALEILERRPELPSADHNSPAYVHLVVEALKHAFADRARWMGDPAFVDVPIDRLLDPGYLDDLAARFDPAGTLANDRYGSVPEGEDAPEDSGTSHLCAVDRWGNAVACTETINLIFGSLVAVDGFGFVLNDTMDDFTTRPGLPNEFGLVQSRRNAIAPGKRALSSMSPTIVLEGDRVLLVAGAAGGPRIISSTLQATLNVLRFDMSAPAALSAGRFHHQWQPDVLWLERSLADGPLAEGLRARGHDVRPRGPIGNVQIIRRSAGGWDAAADPRKGGQPDGH
jgi:gamma-glutamyltranspeptidase/glutathione hydrolase